MNSQSTTSFVVSNSTETSQQPSDPAVEHPRNFFSNVMSVDETRVSVLMICLVVSLIYGAYMYAIKGDVGANWASVIETFAYCVTGINVAAAVTQGGLGQSKVGGLVKSLFGGGSSGGDQLKR